MQDENYSTSRGIFQHVSEFFLFPKVVMTSTKLISILRRPESKPSLVNNGGVSYIFNCPEACCESRYVGITSRHLHQRVMEHLMKRKESPSAIYEHLVMHGKKPLFSEHFGCFKVLKKSSSWRFLLFSEAFSIKSLKCDLNRQSDSITLAVFWVDFLSILRNLDSDSWQFKSIFQVLFTFSWLCFEIFLDPDDGKRICRNVEIYCLKMTFLSLQFLVNLSFK